MSILVVSAVLLLEILELHSLLPLTIKQLILFLLLTRLVNFIILGGDISSCLEENVDNAQDIVSITTKNVSLAALQDTIMMELHA